MPQSRRCTHARFVLLLLTLIAVFSLHTGMLCSADAITAHRLERDLTLVLLSYRSPKSLANTLRSLHTSSVLWHPAVSRVVVYFQVLRGDADLAVVTEAFAAPGVEVSPPRAEADDSRVPAGGDDADQSRDGPVSSWIFLITNHFRRAVEVVVMGRRKNLPVARATFSALDAVATPLVLYLECDRPVYAYTANPVLATTAMDAALAAVRSERADVYRLQAYANDLIGTNNAPVLPDSTYGAQSSPIYAQCAAAPRLTATECAAAKSRGERVFHTAYCKNYRKFAARQPQADLCDAFCFAEWASHVVAAPSDAAERSHRLTLHTTAQLHFERLASNNNATTSTQWVGDDDVNRNGRGKGGKNPRATGRSPVGDELALARDAVEGADTICTTSEFCNWTNQPTMYRLAWYQQAVRDPCLKARVSRCVGTPGRRSAVLQEVFFKNNRTAWVDRRYRVCLHRRGLFIHDEVDNRE